MEKLAAEYAEIKDDLVEIENDHLSAAVEAEKEIDAKVAESEKAIETKLTDMKKFQGEISKENLSCNSILAQRNDLQSKLVHYKQLIAEAIESLNNLSLTSTGEKDEDLTFPTIPDEDLAEVDTNAVSQQAAKTKAALDECKIDLAIIKIDNLLARPNLSAMKEYRDKNEVYTNRRDEFNEINDVRNRKREMRNDLMKMRREGK